jgi:predicted small metal-binding protein
MLVNCECGQVIRAEGEDELIAKVELHVNEHHPDLVEKLGRDQILAMAEQE